MFRRLEATKHDFEHIKVIWQNLAKHWPNMGVAIQNPLKSSVTGPCLLVNCYIEIKFLKKNQGEPPSPLIKWHEYSWETPGIEPVTSGLTSVYQPAALSHEPLRLIKNKRKNTLFKHLIIYVEKLKYGPIHHPHHTVIFQLIKYFMFTAKPS